MDAARLCLVRTRSCGLDDHREAELSRGGCGASRSLRVALLDERQAVGREKHPGLRRFEPDVVA